MSTLLEQASLIMIPSGYKEDVVYSVIPENGNGDLSFTRASNGTRVNSAGLVEVCPWNLVSYSEEFDNAGWTKSGGSTITANNTTAPNGTLTADRINLLASTYSGAYQFINQPIGVYANSIYAKAGTFNYLFVLINGSSVYYVWFNLATGTVGSKGANMEGTIESVGNGWYRCTASRILNNDINHYHQFGFSDAENYTPTTTGTAYIWGAQSNIGSTAKPYFPTTDRLNVPRLTYQNGGGGCPSLLLEKQSTNLLSYSQDFTNAYWSKLGQGVGDTAIVTANYAISPDGTQNATRFVCNLNGGTTASARSWMIASFTAQATSTISIWIKLNSAGTKTVLLSDSGGGTKTISGTDWQRIDATFVGAGGEFRIGLIGGSTSDTLDCCIWGAQAESGSYPTSYIPTTSSSATRVADACSKTGISSLIGQTEGVIFWDINFVADGTEQTINISDGTNFIYLQKYSDNKIYTGVYYGSFVGSIESSVLTSGRKKIAFGYILNSLVLYINGVSIGTDLTSTIPTCDRLSLTVSNTGSIETNNFILFPTKLTNAELASLTTI